MRVQKSELRKDLVVGIVVALVAFFAYAGSLSHHFVWDDSVIIASNPEIKGDPGSLFFSIDRGRPSDPITPYYRPITMLTFLLEYRLHGLDPHLVRLFNVLLHSASAFLVFNLARSLKISTLGALFAGLLFAVHPLHAEAVNFNAGGRNTMLATLFSLGALAVHRWSVRHGSLVGLLVGAVVCMAGFFSKETALAVLPFILFEEAASFRKRDRGAVPRAIFRLFPYVVALAIYLVMRGLALSQAGVSLDVVPGLAGRLLDDFYIIPRYLLNVLWPVKLSPAYYIPEDLNVYALPLLAGWVFIGVVLWWILIRDRNSRSLYGLAWLAVFWLPVSGIVPIPSAPLADRYFYLPAVGIWLIVADQLDRRLFAQNRWKIPAIAAAGVLLVLLAGVTWRQSMIWKNGVTLFTLLSEQNPDKAFVFHNLGCAYLDEENNLYLAQRNFEKTLLLDPTYPRTRTQLGWISLVRGDFPAALEHYDHAVYLNPLDSEAILNRGKVLEFLGRTTEAAEAYRKFLSLQRNELPFAKGEVVVRLQRLEKLREK